MVDLRLHDGNNAGVIDQQTRRSLAFIHMHVEVVYRTPTVDEFAAMARSVGFKSHSAEAIGIGLSNTWCSVCALSDETVMGAGRIVGDGALHFYITDIMVMPPHQRRGVGGSIVHALLAKVKALPYENMLVEALPLPGLERFYARFGFKASRQYAPGMHLWLNRNDG